MQNQSGFRRPFEYNTWGIFIKNCNKLNERNIWRIAVETSLFFSPPVHPVGLFLLWYQQSSQNSKTQVKRHDRNRTLTLAFSTSWVLWLFCWTLTYLLARINIAKLRVDSSYGALIDTILGCSVFLMQSLQMLYSYLNPIFNLVIIKDFQDLCADWLQKLQNCLFCVEMSSENENASGARSTSRSCII